MTAPAQGQPEGVALVDKPSGITSHDAVATLRRVLGTRKVGHAGTLDPMATGLLVVGVGRATRLLRFLGGLPKTYEGTMRLGVITTTLDADGDVVATADPDGVLDDAVRTAMAGLLGEGSQVPPAYSAVKVGGRKLYAAARAGEIIEAEPRAVRVDLFEMTRRRGADVGFVCVVSGGTYVRVLASDVGAALGVGAHLVQLRRTAIGGLSVHDATPPEGVTDLLPLEVAVAHLPRVTLDGIEAEAASHGRVLGPAGFEGPYGVFGPDGSLVGIWRDEGPRARPEMVLAPR